MRKIGIITIIFFLFNGAFAQTYVGLKGAYTMSTVSFKPTENNKILFGSGLDYGVMFRYYDLKHVGFQAEMYYTKRGYRKPTDDTNAATYKRVNSYIELPIFFQLRINLKVAYFHAEAGPYIAYLLSATEGDNTSGEFIIKNVDFNVLRDNRFDYGLMGGFGLSYDFRWGTIMADARVGYGFADLYNHTYTDMPDQSKAVIQSISVSYLYRFGNYPK